MSSLITLAKVLAPILSTIPIFTQEELMRGIDANHPKIRGARANIDAARGKRQEKRGAFDPVFSIDTSSTRYNSTSSPGTGRSFDGTEGLLEMTMPNGMKVFAGSRLNIGSVKSPASSTGNLGEYFAGIKMPLFRGNGLNEKSVAERQAAFGIDIAEQDAGAVRLTTMLDGGNAYWEWVAANQKRTVARDLLRVAEQRADFLRRRLKAGDLAEIDVVEAETEVRRREGNLAKAERDYQKAQLKLNLYRWDNDGEPLNRLVAAPRQIPTPAPMPEERIIQATEGATRKRPEVRVFDYAREVLQLSLGLARNDRRPQVDLVLNPGLDPGVGGIGQTAKAGIFYSIPLRQNNADGRIREAEQKLRKLNLDRELVTQQVRTEVADAASAVNQAYLRYLAATDELALARRLEAGERLRFEIGEGTLFLLNQRERATAEAAARLIDVVAEYQAAMVAFNAASAEL